MRLLGVESRKCWRVLGSARLGQRLDRLPQELLCPRPANVSRKDKKQLGVPTEGLRESYERLGNRPVNLARLDPADLRSREATPPCQFPHRQARTHSRLSDDLSQRLFLVLHRAFLKSVAAYVTLSKF